MKKQKKMNKETNYMKKSKVYDIFFRNFAVRVNF